MLYFIKNISKPAIMVLTCLTLIFSIYQSVGDAFAVPTDSILQQEYDPYTDPATAPGADISELSEMDPALPSYPQRIQISYIASWLPYHAVFDSMMPLQLTRPPTLA